MTTLTARQEIELAIRFAEGYILHTYSCLDALPLVGCETEKARLRAVIDATYSHICAKERRLVALRAS